MIIEILSLVQILIILRYFRAHKPENGPGTLQRSKKQSESIRIRSVLEIDIGFQENKVAVGLQFTELNHFPIENIIFMKRKYF